MLQIITSLTQLVTLIFFRRHTGQSGLVLMLAIGSLLLAAPSVNAGGGPENVFLLVNSKSQDSLTVANHYITLRNIPPKNVMYIPYEGSKEIASGAGFRNKFLLPALDEIKSRNLTGQIDYMIYSCDFPWKVTFAADFPGENFPLHYSPQGSLTGLTYLQAFVKDNRKEVVSLNSNWYYIESLRGLTISRAFRSQYRWAAGGRRTGGQGLSYMISSMLGVTDGRGNKVEEIVRSLEKAKSADGTKPSGTVYYMKHKGKRSQPRHEYFDSATSELRMAGVEAQVLQGQFPSNKMMIAGLTCGVGRADLAASKCRFIPGAFCDNLTSYGAMFTIRKPRFDKKTGKKIREQTTATDFIRYGATAACGTVVEPLAIRQKFPLPSVHVHYAKGCSIGEAFYQSVGGPYQQLLVGDPLCQPWAEIPIVVVKGISKGQLLKGQVEIVPSIKENQEIAIREFELYVDGDRIQSCKPGEKLSLDTTKLLDGHHEIRIVARDNTPIETQGRLLIEVTVKNGTHAIGLITKQKGISLRDKYLTVEITSTQKKPVDVFCNGLQVGSLPTGSGPLSITTSQLGSGPVSIYAKCDEVRSKPLQVKIAPK